MGYGMIGGGLFGMLFAGLLLALLVAVVWIFNQAQRR
jgi:hypothetical protein